MEILEKRAEWSAAFEAGWLAHFKETGEQDWKIYNRPYNSPLGPTPGLDLSQSRLVLISSAGTYLTDSQEAFDASNPVGDYTLRVWPIETPFTDLSIAHDHYDHSTIQDDPQVLLPIQHLQDMVAEGKIGELVPHVISYMGYEPDIRRTVDELAPQIVSKVHELGAEAALLVPS